MMRSTGLAVHDDGAGSLMLADRMGAKRGEDGQPRGRKRGQQAADQRCAEPCAIAAMTWPALGHQRRRRKISRGEAAVEDGPEHEAGNDPDRDTRGGDRGHLDSEEPEHLPR